MLLILLIIDYQRLAPCLSFYESLFSKTILDWAAIQTNMKSRQVPCFVASSPPALIVKKDMCISEGCLKLNHCNWTNFVAVCSAVHCSTSLPQSEQGS